MKTNKLTFVGQIRKGNMIITTYVDAYKNEFRFAKLVRPVAKVTKLEEVRAIKESKAVAVQDVVVKQVVGAEQVSSQASSIVAEEVEQVEEVVDITPINKPSDRFDIDDYIAYHEYMIKHGGKPSVANYFQARAYYIDRA